MIERLRASRRKISTVVVIEREGSGMRTLTGSEAHSAQDRLVSESHTAVPLCEAAGMLAFRRAGLIEFYLFEGENVQSALSAMAGR